MKKKNRLIIISTAILFLISVVFNIVNFLSYKYHVEVHKRYEQRLNSYISNMLSVLSGIEDTLSVIIDKESITYKECLFLEDNFSVLYQNFNSLKEELKDVYIDKFELDLYKTNEFRLGEPRHDLLIPANQLFSATLKEFSSPDEQINLASLKLLTNTKLEHLNNIVDSINLIIENNMQVKLST
mgnify:FL=1